MRKFLTALVILLAVYLVISRFAEVQLIAETLRRGNAVWLGLAVLVQLAWLVNVALVFQAIYRLLGMRISVWELLPLVASSNFVNVAAPTAGVGGIAIFVADARQRRLSTGRVTIAGVLFVLFDYFGFLCVLALGLIVLIRRNSLNPGEVVASAVLLTIALALAGLLGLGMRSASRLEHVLVDTARTINQLVRPWLGRDYLSEARAHAFAVEAGEGLSALRARWSDYLLPAALALSSKALLISILFLMFLAFKQPFSSGTLIAGFSLAYLFAIVSPTPAGIGVVEGVMTLSLNSLRVPLAAATVITFAYRGLTFWLPFAYGFVAFRLLQRRWGSARAATPSGLP
jgi:hypothetical protein